MSARYRLLDSLDRTVTIKVLSEHVGADPDLRQRVERGVETISSLNDPHICTLHDIGSQDGIDFLVMEYLEGETLVERLKGGAPSLDEALRCGVEISEALHETHRAGVTHRGISSRTT